MTMQRRSNHPSGLPNWLAEMLDLPLCGRRAELERLAQAWQRARAGASTGFVIAGSAGTGKTRLAVELASQVGAAGAQLIWASCDREAALPLAPWLHVARQLRAVDAPEVARALEPFIALGASRDGGGRTRAQRSAEDIASELSGSLRSALDAACEHRSLLLVFDDVHWAGSQTLSTLRHLLVVEPVDGLAVVLTHRSEPSEVGPALERVLFDLRRLDRVDTVELGALSETAIDELTDVLVSAELNDDQRQRLRSSIAERCGGNPFFTVQLARHVNHGDLTTPTGIADLVGQRRRDLGPQASRVLDLVAVAETIELPVLRRALGPDSDLEGLRTALGAALLVESSSPRLAYQYVHALFREAVLAGIDRLSRAELHWAIGTALEQVDPAHRDLAALTRHFAGASPLAGPGKAVLYGRRAATAARLTAAYAEAVTLLDLVASALPVGNPDRVDLLIEATDLATRAASSLSTARDRVRTAIGEARSTRDPLLMARAAVVYERLAQHLNEDDPTVRQALGVAIEHAGALPPTIRNQLEAALGRAEALAGDPAGLERAERTVQAARELAEPETLANALEAATLNPLDPQARLRNAVELHDLTIDPPNPWRRMWSLANALSAQLELGDLPAARALLAKHQSLAETYRYSMFHYQGLVAEAGLALVEDRADDAERAINAAHENPYDESFRSDGVFGLVMFLTRRAQGRLGAIRPLLEHLDTTSAGRAWQPGLALCYAELGLEGRALQILDHLVPSLSKAPLDASFPVALAFAAETVEMTSAAPFAEQLYPLLLPYSGRVLTSGLHIPLGPADRHLAATAHLLGRAQDAEAHLGRAVALATRAHAPAWAAANRRTAALSSIHSGSLPTPAPSGSISALTQREADVLRAVADGLTNRQIAARLYISPNTAANHVRAILRKTGAANRTDAAVLAHRFGLR